MSRGSCLSAFARPGLFALTLGLPPLLAACRPPEPPKVEEKVLSLAVGTVAESTLAGGGSQVYCFDLAAGRYAGLAVEQRGIDVAVTLYAPDGRRLTRVDGFSNAQGPEIVPLVAETGGRYRLEIEAGDPAAAPGRYRIEVDEMRPATDRDRRRVAAERLLATAEELQGHLDPASLQRGLVQGRKAAGLLASLGETGRAAEALYCLGALQEKLGDSAAALALFERSLAAYRKERLRPQAASALTRLGALHAASGKRAPALACYSEALALSRQTGDRRRETNVLNNLGKLHADAGEVEAALDFYEQALAGWRELRLRRDEAYTLYNVGHLYGLQGRPREALDALERSLSLVRGQPGQEAWVLTELGVVRFQAGKAGEERSGEGRQALAPLNRAVALARQVGFRQGEALALNNLGWVHHRLGDRRQARRLYRQSRQIYRELGDRLDEAWVVGNLARLDEELGAPRAAVAAYGEALHWLASNPDGEASALLGLARAHRRLGDLAAAQETIGKAIARVESLRSRVKSPGLRTSFLASRQDFYTFSMDLLMELDRRHPGAGYAARALAASEEGRARGLLDLLAEQSAGPRQEADPALLEQESELIGRINAAARQTGNDRELRRLLAEHDRLRARLLGSTTLDSRPLDLAQIQEQVVDGDTLLLEYALGTERSYLWAVTPGSLASFELPPRAVLDAAARRAHSLLAASDRAVAREPTKAALAELSRTLLGPAAPLLAGRRLLVVPDGALHYLPFGALPEPGTDGPDAEPLAVRHEIVTLPSASALAVLRRELAGRRPAPGLLAVVADPVFDAADPRVVRVAARAARPAATRTPFHRLPFSRVEAQAVLAQALPAQSLRALDFAARREILFDGTLAQYRILHFATHGVLDTAHPELSGIVLSSIGPDGRPREGFVHSYELGRLHLPAELAVLSACDTALGEEVRGEGLVGLTRGFLQAGVRLVLVSLWEVEDRATAELMRRFYEEMLLRGRPPAAALAAAQRSIRRQPGWSPPYYWAGFVLQGDWRAAPGSNKPSAPARDLSLSGRTDTSTQEKP